MFGGIRVALLVVFVSVSAVACAGGEASEGGDGRTGVVATYSILGDLVRNVGGDNVELSALVGPDGDAHTFEPAPSDNVELSEADVVFENGLGFETWLGDLYESSGSEARRVVVTEGIEPLPVAEEHGEEAGHADEHADEEGHAEGEHAEGEHAHEPGESDPHVWHDPTNAVLMVEAVRDALVEADPENAGAYERNAQRYVAELEDLDAEVAAEVGGVPEGNRMIFTSHDTLGYFAERYGFGVDTALASVSTEASDPSAGETADLVGEIEASGVPAIFADNVSNDDVMRRLASDAGVELAPPLYTDALGGPGSEGATYVRMMRYNASAVAGALGG